MNSASSVKDSTLSWGVATGFRGYLVDLPDSSTECAGGCTPSGDEFLFPQSSIIGSGNEFRFSGVVRFTGHHGMLDVQISDPMVQLIRDRWFLTVEEPGSRRPASRSPLAHLPDLTVVRDRDRVMGLCIRPELTFEGTYLFGNVYRTGHHMDPLRFTAAVTTDSH